MGRTSSYAAEFRHEAVQLVLESDKTITQVASDLGISHKTLGNWVRGARAGQVRAALPRGDHRIRA